MTPANDRTGVGKGTAEYQTPDPLYAQMDRRWVFDYDPFATDINAKCLRYSTLEGTFERTTMLGVDAGETGEPVPVIHTLPPVQIDERDGLEMPWANRRCFCNPPYSRGEVEICVQKMAAEATLPLERSPQVIVALLPAATDTNWFHAFVVPFAHITYLRRRIAFIHPPFACNDTCQTRDKPHALGEPMTNPPGAYCIAEYATKWRI